MKAEQHKGVEMIKFFFSFPACNKSAVPLMTDKPLPQNLGLQVLQIVRQGLFPQIPDFQDLNEKLSILIRR